MSERRIARELRVRKARAAEIEMIGADRVGGCVADGAGGGDNVVLVDAVAADADGADEDAVAVQREATGEDRDAVGHAEERERCICVGGGRGSVQWIGDTRGKLGQLFLQTKQRRAVLRVVKQQFPRLRRPIRACN